MEVGVEISQKIRSAIKAKLMELGSYVDDELPDYIMVMVANKKNKAQMVNDLSLFLGANTDAFTTWLHDLLVKLQAINKDTDEDPAKKKSKLAKKKGGVGGKKVKEKKKKKSDETTKVSEEKGSSLLPSDKTKGSDLVSEQSTSLTTSQTTKASATIEIDNLSEKTSVNQTVDKAEDSSCTVKLTEAEDVEDVRELLVIETTTDPLAQELEIGESEVAEKTRTVVKQFDDDKVAQSSSKVLNLKSGRRLSRSKSHSPERSSIPASRKRRKLISVVSAVSKEDDSDDEEEYDPNNPSVGNVASVVKVTSRKPSVPPALQANRALLMKAMSDAERSIAVKRKIGITKPMSRSDAPAETYSPKRKYAHHDDTPPPYIPSKKEIVTSRRGNTQVVARLSRNDARHVLNKEERQELISRSKRQELLQSIGINLEEKPLVQQSSVSKKSKLDEEKLIFHREVRDQDKPREVENFQITTRIVTAPKQGSEVRRRNVSPASKQAGEQVEVVSLAKTSGTSSISQANPRTSGGVTEKSKSSRLTVTGGRVLKKAQGSGRIDLSRLMKEQVKKQCEAAVLSVQKAECNEKTKLRPDSRVVRCDMELKEEDDDDEDDDDEHNLKLEVIDREDIGLITVGKTENIKKVSSNEDSTEDLAEMINNDLDPDLLDDGPNSESVLDLYDEDIIDLVDESKEDPRISTKLDDKKGTRFIVTLDGIDEQGHEGKMNVDNFKPPATGGTLHAGVSGIEREHVVLDALAAQVGTTHPILMQSHQLPQAGLLYSYPAPAKITPPRIQPFSISLKDSDDEHEGKVESQPFAAKEKASPEGPPQLSTLQKAKLSERCKFWPACAAGTDCEFHHPTTHCKTFPNCKFGEKCLFIHPNCRFDSKCARPDCPFTHTSKRPALSAGAAHVISIPQPHIPFHSPKTYPGTYGVAPRHSSVPSTDTVCRFFPNCQNPNCSFLHPKPCHFGLACRSPGCPFYHPPAALPTKDKLKWQASPSSPGIVKLKDMSYNDIKSGQTHVVKVSESNVSVSSNQSVSSTSL